MKFRIILFLGLALSMIGCDTTDDIKSSSERPSLSVYRFDSAQHVLKIAVNPATEWTIAGEYSWCKPDQLSGKGNDSLTIRIEANVTTQERMMRLFITEMEARQSIQIIQAGSSSEYHYKLPVIFHILYNNAASTSENVTGERIYQTISDCNEFYKNSNKSVDMNLEFVPATHDPTGKLLAEPGIERIHREPSIVMDCWQFMGNEEFVPYLWDLNQYINIFIYTFSNKNVTGISHMPYSIGRNGLSGLYNGSYFLIDPTLDYPHCLSMNNIFMQTQHSGLKMPDATLTFTHEMGHYLGLFHVFMEGNTVTDYCDDTETYDRAAYDDWLKTLSGEVSFGKLVKRTSPEGYGFISYNIMDYDYSYLNQFTPDQRKRVRYVLENSPLIPGPKTTGSRTRSDMSMEKPKARAIE
ncbi:MAG: zinc-dependent metalloproteinase lipoprotein [Odoribacter sp.]